MALIANPQKYDDKAPTNIRLEKDVKDALKHESEEKKVDMAEIINAMLKKRYKLT